MKEKNGLEFFLKKTLKKCGIQVFGFISLLLLHI